MSTIFIENFTLFCKILFLEDFTTWVYLIKEKWGNLQLKKINRNDYEEHLAEMLGQYRRNSVLTSNRLLNSILNDAVKNGNLKQNKLSGIYLGESELEPLNKEIVFLLII